MDAAAAPSSVNSRAILKGDGLSKGSNVCCPPPLWIGMFCPGSASHHYDITQEPKQESIKGATAPLSYSSIENIHMQMPSYPLIRFSSQPPPAGREGAAHWQRLKSYKTSKKAQGKRKIKNPPKIKQTSGEGEGGDVRRRREERKRSKTVMTERRLVNQWWEMLSAVTLELNVRAGRCEGLPVIFLIKVIHGAAVQHALTPHAHTHQHQKFRVSLLLLS